MSFKFYIVGEQRCGIPLLPAPGFDCISIKTVQAIFRAEPHITQLIFRNTVNLVFGKTIGDGDVLEFKRLLLCESAGCKEENEWAKQKNDYKKTNGNLL